MKMRISRRPLGKQKSIRRGAALVEFALTVGLAFFFFFAAIEFSRVSMIRHTLDNAVYEASRVGILPGTTEAEVESKARQILATVGVRNATIEITPTPIQLTSPTVVVSITLPLEQNLYAPPFFFKGLTLKSSLSMRREIPNNG